MIKRLVREFGCLIKADKMILHYPQKATVKGRVNLHWYDAGCEGNETARVNLGDVLSPLIVEHMLGIKNIDLGQSEDVRTKHLYAIGSILLMGYQNATVWGTGMPFEPSPQRGLLHRKPFRKLDVRCIRGPKTRNTLIRLGHEVPEVYGDPAVLMPMIYKPAVTKKHEILVIPHFSVEKELKSSRPELCTLSMATEDYRKVIDGIASAERVVSSSLHGIILAETYGVPAVFYRDRDSRFDYKYEDWYLSTGRDFVVYDCLNDAINAEPNTLPPLEKMKEDLIKSFPYDIFAKKYRGNDYE